ncbi:hypothetical protein BU15DRAFT_66258 [Melanogaster broomeanus]|nr:hypothetical protein BU15DRAFT_66258 [Melanogaster broomeanus]
MCPIDKFPDGLFISSGARISTLHNAGDAAVSEYCPVHTPVRTSPVENDLLQMFLKALDQWSLHSKTFRSQFGSTQSSQQASRATYFDILEKGRGSKGVLRSAREERCKSGHLVLPAERATWWARLQHLTLPPVGWQSTLAQEPHSTTDCACEKTVVIAKQPVGQEVCENGIPDRSCQEGNEPGHFTSMKYELGRLYETLELVLFLFMLGRGIQKIDSKRLGQIITMTIDVGEKLALYHVCVASF